MSERIKSLTKKTGRRKCNQSWWPFSFSKYSKGRKTSSNPVDKPHTRIPRLEPSLAAESVQTLLINGFQESTAFLPVNLETSADDFVAFFFEY